MQLPSYAQAYAVGRHLLTAAGTVVATAAFLHLISGDDAGRIKDALSQIGTGVASLAAGIGTLVSIASASYAAYTASQQHQIASVAAMPEVHEIVATHDVAVAAPSEKVVSVATVQQAPQG